MYLIVETTHALTRNCVVMATLIVQTVRTRRIVRHSNQTSVRMEHSSVRMATVSMMILFVMGTMTVVTHQMNQNNVVSIQLLWMNFYEEAWGKLRGCSELFVYRFYGLQMNFYEKALSRLRGCPELYIYSFYGLYMNFNEEVLSRLRGCSELFVFIFNELQMNFYEEAWSRLRECSELF